MTATVKSAWELIRQIAASWQRLNTPRLGAALAFYTMWSIAPLLVLCISIAGLVVGTASAENQVEAQIVNLTGPTSSQAIQSLLANAANRSHGIAATAIGFAMLLFGASRVCLELRDSLDLIWGAPAASGGGLMGMIRHYVFSIAMVLGVGFLLLVSLIVSAGIAAAGRFFESYLPVSETALQLESGLVSFVVATVLFALLYKLVPDVRVEWRDVWMGAAVTSLLFSLGKFLIGLYLGKASFGSAYGAAGSLVVFIVWVYYSAQVFFLGAEFTHVYAVRRRSACGV